MCLSSECQAVYDHIRRLQEILLQSTAGIEKSTVLPKVAVALKLYDHVPCGF